MITSFRKILVRYSGGKTAFAVVSGLIDGDPREVRGRLTQAVTAWVKGTLTGGDLWKRTAADLSISDLACELPNPSLEAILEAHGLRKLCIEIVHEDEAELDWAFDTVLVNAQDLEEASE